MKDFLVGVGIGLVGGSTFAGAVGGSIRRIDHLGKEIDRLQASAARARAIRRLAPEVGRTATAAREATMRATALGRALHTAAQPTRQLRQQFETARNEAKRLSERLAEQQRQLHGYRTAMRQAGER